MKILVYDAECVLNNTRYPIKDALEALGHNVDMFDWSLYFPRYSNSGFIAKVTSKLFEEHYIKIINEHLCSIFPKVRYDLFLVCMGRYIYPETVKLAKKYVGRVCNWNSDDIFNLTSSSQYAKDSLSLYDVHFTARPQLIPEYLKLGAQKVIPLDWYYRPGMLKGPQTQLPITYQYPINFVGSWSHYRENTLSPIMQYGTHIFGWGWLKHASNIRKKYPQNLHNSVSVSNMHDILYNSAINVNLLTVENRDVTNVRNFEIPSAMGFQLSERSDRILELFKEDVEIACFSSAEELKSKCDFYLKNESLRKKIALAGYDRLVRSNYTLENRLETIINQTKLLL